MGSIKLSSLNDDVFNEEEQQYLATHFRVTTDISPDRDSSISAVDLLDEVSCRAYLERIADKIQAPSMLVTASQFAKRYSFLIIAPSLYALSIYNKGVDHSLENCHLESAEQKGTWLLQLRLSDSPKCVLASAEQPIRVRQTCCFYYQISPKQSYCSTCPRRFDSEIEIEYYRHGGVLPMVLRNKLAKSRI